MDSGVTRWLAFALVPPLTALCGLGFSVRVSGDLYGAGHPGAGARLGVLGHAAPYFGLVAGLFCDHWGPSSTVLVGGVLAFLGYEVVSGVIGGYVALGGSGLALGVFLSANAQAWFDTAALVTMLDMFPPESRGQVVGITKALQGLSAGVVGHVYFGLFHQNAQWFLWALPFIALSVASPVSVALAAIADQSLYRPPQPPPPALLAIAYLLTVSLAAYLVSTPLVSLPASPPAIPVVALAGWYLAWGLLPLLAVWHERGGEAAWLAAVPEAKQALHMLAPDVGLLESLRTMEFYLLACCGFASATSGAFFIHVIRGLATAPMVDVPLLVSVFSAGDTAGRLAAGVLPEAYRWHVSRPKFLCAVAAAMAVANAGLACPLTAGPLVALCLLSGLCCGATSTLLPALVGDLFGLASFGAIYNCLQAAHIAGALTASHLLADGLLGAGPGPPPTALPLGLRAALREPFLCTATIGLGAVLAALILLRRTAPAFAPSSPLVDEPKASARHAFPSIVPDIGGGIGLAGSEAPTTNSYGAEDPSPFDTYGGTGNSSFAAEALLPFGSDLPTSLARSHPPAAHSMP
eukprot:EG_transcript_5651